MEEVVSGDFVEVVISAVDEVVSVGVIVVDTMVSESDIVVAVVVCVVDAFGVVTVFVVGFVGAGALVVVPPVLGTAVIFKLLDLFGVQENLEDDMSTLSLVWKIVNPQLKVTFLILMSFLILVVVLFAGTTFISVAAPSSSASLSPT